LFYFELPTHTASAVGHGLLMFNVRKFAELEEVTLDGN
jgi:hypothetical protein